MMTAWQRRARSAGDEDGAAPLRTARSCASARMSRATVAIPARASASTTPPPIAPVPITPTRMLVRSADDEVGAVIVGGRAEESDGVGGATSRRYFGGGA